MTRAGRFPFPRGEWDSCAAQHPSWTLAEHGHLRFRGPELSEEIKLIPSRLDTFSGALENQTVLRLIQMGELRHAQQRMRSCARLQT